MARLELDSSMSESEILAEVDQASEIDHYDELYLNCIEIGFTETVALTKLLSSRTLWRYIEMEECTGLHLEVFLALLFTSRVEKLKLSTVGLARLGQASLFSIALGVRSNTTLKDVVLSLTLTGEDVQTLVQGFSDLQQHLRRLCLWDCVLEGSAVDELAQGIRAASSLQEFGLVACALSEDRLDTLLQAFCASAQLKQLDLRCLASGMAPVASLLQHNRSLQTLDLSFRSGDGEAMDTALLANAIREHPCLRALHVCGNYIADEGLNHFVEAARELSASLKVLNLSLNKITNDGIRHLAAHLANNTLRLQQILLDGNPFSDPSPLLVAIETNTYLEECLIPQEHEYHQQQIHYYARLNRGGRRLVLGPQVIPLALWPLVFERVNCLNFDHCTVSSGRAEVLYCLLHGPLFFPV